MTIATPQMPQTYTPDGYTVEEFDELKESNPGHAICLLTDYKPVLTECDIYKFNIKAELRKDFFASAAAMLAADKREQAGDWKTSKVIRPQLLNELKRLIQIEFKSDDLDDAVNHNGYRFERNDDGHIVSYPETFVTISDQKYWDVSGSFDLAPGWAIPLSVSELAECFEFEVEMKKGVPHLVPGSLVVTDKKKVERLIMDYIQEETASEFDDHSVYECIDGYFWPTDAHPDHSFDEWDLYKNTQRVYFEVVVSFN